MKRPFISASFILWWLWGALLLRPLLDITIWGLEGTRIAILKADGLSIQSVLAVATEVLCALYLWSHRDRMPRRLSIAIAALSFLLAIDAFASSNLKAGLSSFLRIELGFLIFLVLQDAISSGAWERRFAFAGLCAYSFFVLVASVDTLRSGGLMCPVHYVMEAGGQIFNDHQISHLIALVPFAFVFPLLMRDNHKRIFVYLLVAAGAALLYLSFVRQVWIGLIVLLIGLGAIADRRSSGVLGMTLFFAFAGFVAPLVFHPARLVARFYYELPRSAYRPNTPKQAEVRADENESDINPISGTREPLFLKRLNRMGSGRVEIWTALASLWFQQPLPQKLFGLGFDGSQRLIKKEPHSDLLLIWIDMGLAGLALFAWLLVELVRYFREKTRNRLFAGFGLSVVGCMLAVGAASGVLLFTPRMWYFSTFLGWIAALSAREKSLDGGDHLVS